MADHDFYDNNLKTDELVLISLGKEAERHVRQLNQCKNHIEKLKDSKTSVNVDDLLGILQKISYNVRSNHDQFISIFVKEQGLKLIMESIDTTLKLKSYDLLSILLQMVPAIMNTKAGLKMIAKRLDKYLDKFFSLSSVNETCKKNCIRIFYNIAKSNLPNVFEGINNAAEKFADEQNKLIYQSLMQGFGYDNNQMAMILLKFINEMLAKAEDQEQKAQFLAKLEGTGIKEVLGKWTMTYHSEIQDQIQAFEYNVNEVSDNFAYKFEVYKNRVRDLEKHNRVLEAKVEQYKEQ